MSSTVCLPPLQYAPSNITRGENVARSGEAEAALYIDNQCLTRDCIGQYLAMLLPEAVVVTIPKAQDIPTSAEGNSRFLVGIFHKHAVRIGDPELADELSTLAGTTPNLPIVMLSDIDDAEDVAKAFELGVRGYIPANLPIKQAVGVIRLVSNGGTYVPSSILSRCTQRDLTKASSDEKQHGDAEKFSRRQMEVLHRLWQGQQNKTIAYELKMCESTVKVHIRNIMKKLNARNRTQVVLLTRSMQGGARTGV